MYEPGEEMIGEGLNLLGFEGRRRVSFRFDETRIPMKIILDGLEDTHLLGGARSIFRPPEDARQIESARI